MPKWQHFGHLRFAGDDPISCEFGYGKTGLNFLCLILTKTRLKDTKGWMSQRRLISTRMSTERNTGSHFHSSGCIGQYSVHSGINRSRGAREAVSPNPKRERGKSTNNRLN